MRSATILMAILGVLTIAGCDSNGRYTVPMSGASDTTAVTSPNPNNPRADDPLDPSMNPHYMHSRH